MKSAWFDHTNNTATPTGGDGAGFGTVDGTATRLTGGNINAKYGLARSVSVMPGDEVKMEVYAQYVDLTQADPNGAFTAFIQYLATAGATSTGTIIDGGAPGSMGQIPIPIPPISHATDDNGTQAPKAYLNYIFMDRDMNPISTDIGYKQITEAGKESGQDGQHDYLSLTFQAKQAGYLYIYLSNDNPQPVEVYFDDFKVKHIKSPVIQQQDYYPFGRAFNSYQRENSTPNSYLYNSKELQDELALNTYDFGWRQYDPAIARWSVIDLADKRYWMNPYNYVQNNPMNRFDPNGLTDYTLDKKTGDVKKVADTKDDTDRIVQARKDGSIKRRGEGFLGGLVRESKRGEAKTALGGIEKGILKDGQNFQNKDQVISVGGEGQASVDGVKSFTLKLSEYVGKEIRGYSYSSDGSGNATDMVLGKYNDLTNSYGSPTEFVLKYGDKFSRYNILQESILIRMAH